jgi:hypothetical protein
VPASCDRVVTRPSRGVRVRIGRLAGGLAAGVVAGAGVGVGMSTLPNASMSGGQVLAAWLVFGAVFGLAAGLVFGLRAVPGDLAAAASRGRCLRVTGGRRSFKDSRPGS